MRYACWICLSSRRPSRPARRSGSAAQILAASSSPSLAVFGRSSAEPCCCLRTTTWRAQRRGCSSCSASTAAGRRFAARRQQPPRGGPLVVDAIELLEGSDGVVEVGGLRRHAALRKRPARSAAVSRGPCHTRRPPCGCLRHETAMLGERRRNGCRQSTPPRCTRERWLVCCFLKHARVAGGRNECRPGAVRVRMVELTVMAEGGGEGAGFDASTNVPRSYASTRRIGGDRRPEMR